MRLVAVDQSLMSKNACFKRRDDLAAADAAAARTTTTLSTPHVVGAADQQSLAPAQVSRCMMSLTAHINKSSSSLHTGAKGSGDLMAVDLYHFCMQ